MENEKGIGQSAATANATTSPHVSPQGQTGTDGETPGAGAKYGATLNQRGNKSNMRNLGPSRPNSTTGAAKLPVASQGSRKTGKM